MTIKELAHRLKFQWAPTLGGECYPCIAPEWRRSGQRSFNGHPPLGVNATNAISGCFGTPSQGFNGHPTLGVNATIGQMACQV